MVRISRKLTGNDFGPRRTGRTRAQVVRLFSIQREESRDFDYYDPSGPARYNDDAVNPLLFDRDVVLAAASHERLNTGYGTIIYDTTDNIRYGLTTGLRHGVRRWSKCVWFGAILSTGIHCPPCKTCR